MITKIINSYKKTKGRVKNNLFFYINCHLTKIKSNIKYVVKVDDFKLIFYGKDEKTIIWEYLNNYYNIKNIKNKDFVVDIGANIGDFSIFISRKAKKIYSFEPLPEEYKKMNKNIKLNNIKNIKTHNLAISDKDGNFKMNILKSSIGAKLDQNGIIKIKTISWNTLNKITPSKIDLLKIDIEGGEYTLLKQPKILKKVKEIRIELHIRDKKEQKLCIELMDLFKKNRFIIHKNIFKNINLYSNKPKYIEGIFLKK